MFQDIPLKPWLKQVTKKLGYSTPTPIQAMAIPPLLAGESIMALSETGSGKTAVYAFPMLHKLSENPFGVFGVILAPNRELAMQIVEKLKLYADGFRLRTALLIGGTSYLTNQSQLDQVPHIIVGTPGRVQQMLDINEKLKQYIGKCEVLVLDEADRLAQPTMLPAVRAIVNSLPRLKQTVLASATLSQLDGQQLCARLGITSTVKSVSAMGNLKTVSQLVQQFILAPPTLKNYIFFDLVKNLSGSAIVFAGTCKECQLLHLTLKRLGYQSACLHSYMKQAKRMGNLSKFRQGSANILVTTDVSSRGLDIPSVQTVVNYGLPLRPEDYVHRVGRTARAGREGLAVSIVLPREKERLVAAEQYTGVRMTEVEFEEDRLYSQCKQVLSAMNHSKLFMLESGISERFEQMSRMKLKSKREARSRAILP